MRRYSFSAAIGVLALLASALSQGAFPGISLAGDARAAEGLAPEMLPVEIVRGAEDEIVNPGTKTFVNALSRELGIAFRFSFRRVLLVLCRCFQFGVRSNSLLYCSLFGSGIINLLQLTVFLACLFYPRTGPLKE